LARCAARFTSGSLIRPFPNDPEKVFQVNALSVEGWVEQLRQILVADECHQGDGRPACRPVSAPAAWDYGAGVVGMAPSGVIPSSASIVAEKSRTEKSGTDHDHAGEEVSG